MMFHVRQVAVFAMIFCVVGLILYSGIQTQEQPPVQINIVMPTQEMTPQEFEQRHVQRFQRLPAVEKPTLANPPLEIETIKGESTWRHLETQGPGLTVESRIWSTSWGDNVESACLLSRSVTVPKPKRNSLNF